MVRVTCLGGVGTVTGSSYLVESAAGKRVLVDCGLFQGGKQMEERNWKDWGFDPGQIDTLFLTHAHIDHSGKIPKLVKDGFRGRILTSPPTAELCSIMLLDAAHIQEMDAEWQTRKNRRRSNQEVLPLYTTEDAEASLKLLSPVDKDKIVEPEPGIRARMRNSGHILGSSVLELWVEEGKASLKMVFSGDLGKKNQLIVQDPHEIFDADYLFLESTYGNRLHRSLEESKAELLEAIQYAVSHKEKVLIPAFAVERTQEILYILGEFQRAGRLPKIPIYVDSPLAIKATEIFRKNKKYYDEEAQAIVDQGYDPFNMPNLRYTPTTEESRAINETKGSAIIHCGQRHVHGRPDQAPPEAQPLETGNEPRDRRVPGPGLHGPADRGWGEAGADSSARRSPSRPRSSRSAGFQLTRTRTICSNGPVILKAIPRSFWSTASLLQASPWPQKSKSA